jgi:PLP dependent protein
MLEIITNYNKIINQISVSEKKHKDIEYKAKLIAVSKTFESKKIIPLLDIGHKIFGENRVQEAYEKWMPLKKIYTSIELHLIGPLQSNKVNQALEVFDCIQTLDREKIVKKIHDYLLTRKDLQKRKFMIQINTGSEKQKSGIEVNIAKDFLTWCKENTCLDIIGLMCIPPQEEPPELHFKVLNDLADKLLLEHRSMGMSGDFNKAIEYKATYLRLGSAIFGSRKKAI